MDVSVSAAMASAVASASVTPPPPPPSGVDTTKLISITPHGGPRVKEPPKPPKPIVEFEFAKTLHDGTTRDRIIVRTSTAATDDMPSREVELHMERFGDNLHFNLFPTDVAVSDRDRVQLLLDGMAIMTTAAGRFQAALMKHTVDHSPQSPPPQS